VMGENHIHIQNASAYVVETNSHYVSETQTLCAKQGGTYRLAGYRSVQPSSATCPGCLIKAKTIIVNHLYKTEGIIK